MPHIAAFRRSSTLTLLIAPRGLDGDFLEKLISTGLKRGFLCFFPTSPWKDVSMSPCSGGGSSNSYMGSWWWWAEGCLLPCSTGGMLFSSLGHASLHRPEELQRVVCNLFFSHRSEIPQRDKPGCVMHGRLRAIIRTFLSCCCKTTLCSVNLLEDIYCLN